MNNKRWAIVIISIVVASILAIGGVIFYGTAVLPGERKAADVKACDLFAIGVMQARSEAIALAERTPPASDPDIAQKYIDVLSKGIDKAFMQAASKSDVANALAQLGMARISFDATQGFQAVTALEGSYDPVTTACSAVQPSPSASPSSSPSATN